MLSIFEEGLLRAQKVECLVAWCEDDLDNNTYYNCWSCGSYNMCYGEQQNTFEICSCGEVSELIIRKSINE